MARLDASRAVPSSIVVSKRKGRAMRSIISCSICVLALAVATGVDARTRNAPVMSNSQFVTKAAQGGMAEVAAGNLARTRAMDADVRSFAERMVDDHSAANNQLNRLATRKGWRVPANTDAFHRDAMRRLSRQYGRTFDRDYMRMMVDDHVQTVAMFRSFARNGRDPQLRSWAAQKLPRLEDHLHMARMTASRIGALAMR
jgi:putative membrane protein